MPCRKGNGEWESVKDPFVKYDAPCTQNNPSPCDGLADRISDHVQFLQYRQNSGNIRNARTMFEKRNECGSLSWMRRVHIKSLQSSKVPSKN
jgi:hypothetical protein